MRQVPIFQLYRAAAGTIFNPAMRISDQRGTPLLKRLTDGAAGDEFAIETFQQDTCGLDVYGVAHGDDAANASFDQPWCDGAEHGQFADRARAASLEDDERDVVRGKDVAEAVGTNVVGLRFGEDRGAVGFLKAERTQLDLFQEGAMAVEMHEVIRLLVSRLAQHLLE